VAGAEDPPGEIVVEEEAGGEGAIALEGDLRRAAPEQDLVARPGVRPQVGHRLVERARPLAAGQADAVVAGEEAAPQDGQRRDQAQDRRPAARPQQAPGPEETRERQGRDQVVAVEALPERIPEERDDEVHDHEAQRRPLAGVPGAQGGCAGGGGEDEGELAAGGEQEAARLGQRQPVGAPGLDVGEVGGHHPEPEIPEGPARSEPGQHRQEREREPQGEQAERAREGPREAVPRAEQPG
jgi:hypothetical protein